MFSAETVRQAREALEKMEKSTGVATLIETITTLGGEPIDTVALRLARRSGLRGVFILIAKQESKIEVLVSRSYSEAIPQPVRHRVRDAFVEYFRRASFDDGLRQGIATLQTALAAAKTEGKLPQAERPAPDGAPRARTGSENGLAHGSGRRFRRGQAVGRPWPRSDQRRAPGGTQPDSIDVGRSTHHHRRRGAERPRR